jgi:predicted transposase/invertase (TIGR01784 family)
MSLKKDINNIHDKSYKDLYSNKEVFIDLVKSTLNASWARELKAEQLTLVNRSYISSDYEEKESDIVYKANVNGSEVIFYILLEFQSSVDYRMPLRLFFYISEILREYAKNAEHKAYDKNIKKSAIADLL